MHLKVLARDKWTMLAPASKGPDGWESELERVLCDEKGDHLSWRLGLIDLIGKFAEHGNQSFTPQQLHYADEKLEMWRLQKGELRLFFFYPQNISERMCVVFTHHCYKNTGKTSEEDKTAFRRMKQIVEDAIAQDQIYFVEEPENEDGAQVIRKIAARRKKGR